jgi:uncharacterized protein (UPF0305 family)
MSLFAYNEKRSAAIQKIQSDCEILATKKNQGELGSSIAYIVLTCSPHDLIQMKWNFSVKIREYSQEYREQLVSTITAFLHGTYQNIRLMNQQGVFSDMQKPITDRAPEYWKMVALQCSTGNEKNDKLRFLKFLLSGFCMFVLEIPGHPVGMPFPGGDKVTLIDGVYYCPVRTKTHEVDSALCPYCPAEQTPEIGYLKPPVGGSEYRKQEFIKNCYDHHHFNG